MSRILTLAIVCVAGCELLEPVDTKADTAGDTGLPTPTTPPITTTTTVPPTDPIDWWFSSHPCFGNRTDTMWFDDADHVFVGCGSTTVGTGLFASDDGGRTWTAPVTDPAAYLDAFRVSSISRSDDGLLYIAGIDTLSATRVVSMDASGALTEVFASGGLVWNSFQVGTFRRNAAGLSVAESLTGTGLVYRFDDADPWLDGYGWWTSGTSHQILDMVLHDDAFYGVGSTISEPPYVFLPPQGGQDPSAGFALVPIELSTGLGAFDGELWGIDVDAAGVVAAGVDQGRDAGVVFVSGPDPYDLGAWLQLDVSTLIPSSTTWMRGACRSGATVVAVGEYSSTGDGLILRSDDAGATWSDVTPAHTPVPAVQRCKVWPDGDFAVTGAEGFFARFDP